MFTNLHRLHPTKGSFAKWCSSRFHWACFWPSRPSRSFNTKYKQNRITFTCFRNALVGILVLHVVDGLGGKGVRWPVRADGDGGEVQLGERNLSVENILYLIHPPLLPHLFFRSNKAEQTLSIVLVDGSVSQVLKKRSWQSFNIIPTLWGTMKDGDNVKLQLLFFFLHVKDTHSHAPWIR